MAETMKDDDLVTYIHVNIDTGNFYSNQQQLIASASKGWCHQATRVGSVMVLSVSQHQRTEAEIIRKYKALGDKKP